MLSDAVAVVYHSEAPGGDRGVLRGIQWIIVNC